jgi:hypothetical protein
LIYKRNRFFTEWILSLNLPVRSDWKKFSRFQGWCLVFEHYLKNNLTVSSGKCLICERIIQTMSLSYLSDKHIEHHSRQVQNITILDDRIFRVLDSFGSTAFSLLYVSATQIHEFVVCTVLYQRRQTKWLIFWIWLWFDEIFHSR